MFSDKEAWLCKSISTSFGCNYFCYTYKDLDRVFFKFKGYDQTLREALNVYNTSYSNRLLHHLADLIKGPIVYDEITLRHIYYACIAMRIPLMHLLVLCDKCFEHQEKKQYNSICIDPVTLFTYNYLLDKDKRTVIAGEFVRSLYFNKKNTTITNIFLPFDTNIALSITTDLLDKLTKKSRHTISCSNNRELSAFEIRKDDKPLIVIILVKDFNCNDKYKFVRYLLNDLIRENEFRYCVFDWKSTETREYIHFTKYIDRKIHPNVASFVRLVCRSMMCITDKPVKDHHTKYFNALKNVYQNNYRLYSLYAALAEICVKRERVGNFACKTNRVKLRNYDDKREIISVFLEAPCMSEFKSSIKVERSLKAYTSGFIIGTNSVKLGNFLAVYNAFMIQIVRRETCTIHFEYDVINLTQRQYQNHFRQPLFKSNVTERDILERLTRKPKERSSPQLDKTTECVQAEYNQEAYNKRIKDKLFIDYHMNSEKNKVFAVFTGIVMHATIFVTGPICKAKIINKPLVRFINKHKTMTCSYYKELSEKRKAFPQDVKINFNFQGTDYFIRSKLLSTYDRLYDVCTFSEKFNPLKVSNQCAHIRGIHYGVLNVHNYRDRLLSQINCFKIPSFPGLRLVNPNQIDRPMDNLIHRETVLTRIHKTHNMIDNIDKLISTIYPYCERVQELHDVVYGVESELKFVLHGTILGILKMYFLYHGKEELIDSFINLLWINQFIVAQNGSTCRAPMCHGIKETSAIKNTSIKTAKIKSNEPHPPVINDPELFKKIIPVFKDLAVGSLSPKLWKRRGAFNYISVLMQSPTRVVYGKTGKRLISALYDLLYGNGGRDAFPDCFKLLDVYEESLIKREDVKK